MDRVIRSTEYGDETAVVYSPKFGAGWFTWNQVLVGSEQLLFDPVIVNAVLEKETATDWIARIENRVAELFPGQYVSSFGIPDLEVEWVGTGQQFIVREYDGFESIETFDDMLFVQA